MERTGIAVSNGSATRPSCGASPPPSAPRSSPSSAPNAPGRPRRLRPIRHPSAGRSTGRRRTTRWRRFCGTPISVAACRVLLRRVGASGRRDTVVFAIGEAGGGVGGVRFAFLVGSFLVFGFSFRAGLLPRVGYFRGSCPGPPRGWRVRGERALFARFGWGPTLPPN